jgi:hypothetical protein
MAAPAAAGCARTPAGARWSKGAHDVMQRTRISPWTLDDFVARLGDGLNAGVVGAVATSGAGMTRSRSVVRIVVTSRTGRPATPVTGGRGRSDSAHGFHRSDRDRGSGWDRLPHGHAGLLSDRRLDWLIDNGRLSVRQRRSGHERCAQGRKKNECCFSSRTPCTCAATE